MRVLCHGLNHVERWSGLKEPMLLDTPTINGFSNSLGNNVAADVALDVVSSGFSPPLQRHNSFPPFIMSKLTNATVGFKLYPFGGDRRIYAPVKPGTSEPDLANLEETVKTEIFEETRAWIDYLLSSIDSWICQDKLKDAYYDLPLKNLSGPPRTPFLARMFGLEEYWVREKWKTVRETYKEEGECLAPTPLPVTGWKVEKGANGHMIVVVDRETLENVEDECRAEYDDIQNWLISHYEQRYKHRAGAHWELLYRGPFKYTLRNLNSWFKLLNCLVPEEWHDAVSFRTSECRIDVDEEGWTTVVETPCNSLSSTQPTQSTTLSNGQV